MKQAIYYMLFTTPLMHTIMPDLIESSLALLEECIDEQVYVPRVFNRRLDNLLADMSIDDLINYILQTEELENRYLINGAAAVIVDRLDDETIDKETTLTHLKNILSPSTYAFINKYIDFKNQKKQTRACGNIELSIADYVSLNDLPLEYLGNIGILRFDNKNLTSLYGIQDISLSDVGLILLTQNCIVGDTLDPQFPSDPFPGLSNAYNLLINKNMIESLPATFFQSTPSMRVVNLSQNHLTTIPSALTNYTDQIAILKLSYNMLTSIPASDTMSIPLLEYLYLDNNALNSLPSNLLTNNPALNYLFLNNNQFATWPVGELDNQVALIYLDLSYNSLIDFIPDTIIDGAEVILTGNPLTTLQQGLIQATHPAVSFLF